MPLSEQDKIQVVAILRANEGNISHTARETGHSRKTVRKCRDEILGDDADRASNQSKVDAAASQYSNNRLLNFQHMKNCIPDDMLEQESKMLKIIRLMILERMHKVIPETTSLAHLSEAFKILDQVEQDQKESGRYSDPDSNGMSPLAQKFVDALRSDDGKATN